SVRAQLAGHRVQHSRPADAGRAAHHDKATGFGRQRRAQFGKLPIPPPDSGPTSAHRQITLPVDPGIRRREPDQPRRTTTFLSGLPIRPEWVTLTAWPMSDAV